MPCETQSCSVMKVKCLLQKHPSLNMAWRKYFNHSEFFNHFTCRNDAQLQKRPLCHLRIVKGHNKSLPLQKACLFKLKKKKKMKKSLPKTETFQLKKLRYFSYFFSNEAVLTSSHNLCFRAEKKNNVYMYPCKPQFYYIKVVFKACFHDGFHWPM